MDMVSTVSPSPQYHLGHPYVLNTDADLAGLDVIKFGIESKHSSPLTSTDGFKAAISEALQDMRSVCSAGLKSSSSSTVISHL